MSEWKEYKLGDLVVVNERSIGKNFNFNQIEYIDTSSVTENRFDTPIYTSISDAPSRAKRLISNGDTIISTVRPILKHYGFIKKAKENQVVSTGFAVVTPKNIESRFLYYYLTQEKITEYLNTIAEGATTTFPAFRADELKKLSISIPNFSTQKSISEILSSLDEKIELNNKINQELETLAKILFKQWFIDFEFPNENREPYKSSGGEMVDSELGEIPKGWEVKKLKEIGSLKMGLSPKGESYNFEQIGIPLLNGAADYNNGLIEPKKYTTDSQRCNEIGDLVFCIRATIGNLVFADEIYCLGRGVASFKSTIPDNQFIIFQILNNSFEMLKSQASGSVILGLTKDDINDIKLIFNEAEFLNYSSLVSDFFKLIKSNRYENKELTSLRDTLLPKLIIGELQINDN